MDFITDVRLEYRWVAHYRRSYGATACLWMAGLSIDTFLFLTLVV